VFQPDFGPARIGPRRADFRVRFDLLGDLGEHFRRMRLTRMAASPLSLRSRLRRYSGPCP